MVTLQYFDTTCCKRQHACSFQTIDESDYALFGYQRRGRSRESRESRPTIPAALFSSHPYYLQITTFLASLLSSHLCPLTFIFSRLLYPLHIPTLSLRAYPLASLLSSHPSALQISVLSLSLSHVSLLPHIPTLPTSFFSFTSLVSDMPASLHICSFHTPTLLPKRSKRGSQEKFLCHSDSSTRNRHPTATPCSGALQWHQHACTNAHTPAVPSSTAQQQQRQHPRSKAHRPL